MPMVKKFIDIVFPVRALPKDDKERAKVISEYEKIVIRDNDHIIEGFVCMIVMWWLAAYFITHFFQSFNNLLYICLSIPIIIYILNLVLYVVCRIRHISILSKQYYFIYLLCIDILGANGFNILVGVFDTDYDYMSCLILLLVTIAGYYGIYLCFALKFNSNITKYSRTTYSVGITLIITVVSYMIIKHLSVNSQLSIAGLGGFLLAILPAYKFVNYRQYDNIQRAKNGEPFK